MIFSHLMEVERYFGLSEADREIVVEYGDFGLTNRQQRRRIDGVLAHSPPIEQHFSCFVVVVDQIAHSLVGVSTAPSKHSGDVVGGTERKYTDLHSCRSE